uniref:Uncharacterized protein n=1 Tax=Peronospora matthiolae TaxID=2874970 RepID=A0AAV1UGN9_9STRA
MYLISLSLFALSSPALWTSTRAPRGYGVCPSARAQHFDAREAAIFSDRFAAQACAAMRLLTTSGGRRLISSRAEAPRASRARSGTDAVDTWKHWRQDVDRPDVTEMLVTPVSLPDIRQMVVHLYGGLAFSMTRGSSTQTLCQKRGAVQSRSSAATADVGVLGTSQVMDFGNYLEADKLAAYADVDARNGFDVHTATYRPPKVDAGLLLCSVMDIWSLSCQNGDTGS